MAALYLVALVVVCLTVLGVMLDAVVSTSRKPVWSKPYAELSRLASPVEVPQSLPPVAHAAPAALSVPKASIERKHLHEDLVVENEEEEAVA
jgi:hypothetical protein